MAIDYLAISYPNFVLDTIIDPDEANTNNAEIVDKINENIELTNLNEANLALLNQEFNDFVDTTNQEITSIKTNITNLANVKSDKTYVDAQLALKSDKTHLHDDRYYTKTEINNQMSGKANAVHNHNSLYYTKQELQPYLQGGDTLIKEEVFTIINADNGDGTFTYNNGVQNIIGEITSEGYQVFKLTNGEYLNDLNRIEVIINDTLRRSVASGGLIEIDNTTFALSPEGSGAEITAKYYERIGLTGEHNLIVGTIQPPQTSSKTVWFKVVG